MNSPRLPPLGNKLILPKISYGKLDKDSSSQFQKRDRNDAVSDENSDNKCAKSRTSMLSNKQEHANRSFTTFEVLPPIPGRQRAPRRLSQARLLPSNFQSLDINSNEVVGSRGNHDGTQPDSRRKPSVLTVARRRGSSREPWVATTESINNNLEIVGSAYGERCQSHNDNRQKHENGRRPSIRSSLAKSFSAEGTGEFECEKCGKRAAFQGGNNANWAEHDYELCRKSRKSPRVVIQGHNSEATEVKTGKASELGADPDTTNTGKLSVKSTVRPLSRGQISFGLNDRDLAKTPQSSPRERRRSSNRLSISMPVIQINELSASENGPNKDNDNDTPPSHVIPRIQLLLDSLENAKGELSKQQIGVPYTSVREKRRRSALCRNNSKQVDDFLLVHNLRDLGLL